MKGILQLGFLWILCILFSGTAVSQVPRKVLPRSVNVINKHNIAPSLSSDGKTMIYLSTYSGSGEPELKISTRTGTENWTTPEDIKEVNKFLDLNFVGGYCLSADGNEIFFTSKRGQGIGEYDILYTRRQGSGWSPAVNIGKPINSVGSEGAPSISPDGQYLYFMRCRKMTRYEAEGCEIWMAKRRNEQIWETPERLPYPVNSGNDQFPTIFPDNRTMIFSSTRTPGKGGLDFYITQNNGTSWSDPRPLDFLNSEKDEAFLSVTGKGDEVYFSTEYRGKENLIVSKLPDDYQGYPVVLMNGKVLDSETGYGLNAFIQIYDAHNQSRLQYARSDPDDGNFYSVFPVAGTIDFSVLTTEPGYFYSSRLYIQDEMKGSEKTWEEIKLVPIRPGLVMPSEALRFIPGTSDVDPASKLELKRIAKVLKDNPGFNIELQVHSDRIIRDSIRSSPDLTEIQIDTIYQFPSQDSLKIEEESAAVHDEVNKEEDDGFITFEEAEDVNDGQTSDHIDEIHDQPETSVPAVEKIIYTYHNDRTEKQAEALFQALRDLGVPKHRFITTGYSDRFLKYSSSENSSNEKNNRVELRFFEN